MSGLRLASVLSVAFVLSTPALAQDAGSAPGPTGFRGDYLKGLGRLEQQLVSLEQAMPQAKFTWRPAKGVRSVAEVYLHVAGGIYFLIGQLGVAPPADVKALMESKKWETQTTKKDEIKTILTNAFAFLRKAVNDTSDADLDKTVKMFGNQLSERMVYMVVLGHCSEHLGQSIAYARMNGVVPPWSKGDSKD
ncbi:MAG: DinB family protein [Myxococcaceae bacterium]